MNQLEGEGTEIPTAERKKNLYCLLAKNGLLNMGTSSSVHSV